MKRVTIEVVIDCPVDKNPLKLIHVKTSTMVSSSEKKVTKEEALEDRENPSIQRKAEFFVVRQIIQDGLKKALTHYRYFRVYGTRAKEKQYISIPGEFIYWADWTSTDTVEQYALRGLQFAVDKGMLTWFRDGNEIKTMSVGDPNIVTVIASYMTTLMAATKKKLAADALAGIDDEDEYP